MLTSKAADTWPTCEHWPRRPGGDPGHALHHNIVKDPQITTGLAWAASSVTRQCVQSGQTSPVPLWLLLSAVSAVVVVVLLSGPGPVLLNAKDESEWGRHGSQGAARTSSWSRCRTLNLGPGWTGLHPGAGTCLTSHRSDLHQLIGVLPRGGSKSEQLCRPEVKIRSHQAHRLLATGAQPLQIWRLAELRNSEEEDKL